MGSHIRETKLPLMLGTLNSAAADIETASECASECAKALGPEFAGLEIQLAQLSRLTKAALLRARNAAGQETAKSAVNTAAARQ